MSISIACQIWWSLPWTNIWKSVFFNTQKFDNNNKEMLTDIMIYSTKEVDVAAFKNNSACWVKSHFFPSRLYKQRKYGF